MGVYERPFLKNFLQSSCIADRGDDWVKGSGNATQHANARHAISDVMDICGVT